MRFFFSAYSVSCSVYFGCCSACFVSLYLILCFLPAVLPFPSIPHHILHILGAILSVLYHDLCVLVAALPALSLHILFCVFCLLFCLFYLFPHLVHVFWLPFYLFCLFQILFVPHLVLHDLFCILGCLSVCSICSQSCSIAPHLVLCILATILSVSSFPHLVFFCTLLPF